MNSVEDIRWKEAQEAESKWWAQGDFAYRHFSRKYWADILMRDGLDGSFWKDQNVLEIGCGPKGMIYYFPEAKNRIGVEPLAEFYKKQGLISDEGVDLKAGMGESLDIKDGKISRVIIFNVLDHAQDPLKCLQEALRVSAKGSILYLASNVFPKWLLTLTWLMEKLDHPHPHHFTKNDLLVLVEKSGWKITEFGKSEVEPKYSFFESFKPLVIKKIIAHTVKSWFHIKAVKI